MENRAEWLEARKSQIESMYNSFMTQEEIGKKLGVHQWTISNFMKNNGIKARVAAKRDQRGSKNHNWQGENVSYKGAHDRVRSVRGVPQKCVKCYTTEGKLEWASMSKQHYDPNDYQAMCIPCHRKHDMDLRVAKIQKKCPVCSKEWVVGLSRKNQIHCSYKCYGVAQSIQLNHQDIVDLYQFGYSKKQIADKYNLSQKPIGRILKIHNVPVRSKSNRGYHE